MARKLEDAACFRATGFKIISCLLLQKSQVIPYRLLTLFVVQCLRIRHNFFSASAANWFGQVVPDQCDCDAYAVDLAQSYDTDLIRGHKLSFP